MNYSRNECIFLINYTYTYNTIIVNKQKVFRKVRLNREDTVFPQDNVE